jgi:nucleoside-diphosphate-sugar epimerase
MTIPRRRACTLFIVLLYVNTAAVLGFVFPKAGVARVSSSSLSSLLNHDENESYNINEDFEIASLHRRSALEKCRGIALSSLLLSSSTSVVYPANAYVDYDDDSTKKKRILITGSNSGIGLDAAQRMVLRGHEVVLACVS